jgi:hypothetical protein
MRGDAMEAARHACEVCFFVPSSVRGEPLTCHEVWHYDDKDGVGTLIGLRMQCSGCDSVVQMARAKQHGGFDKPLPNSARSTRSPG